MDDFKPVGCVDYHVVPEETPEKMYVASKQQLESYLSLQASHPHTCTPELKVSAMSEAPLDSFATKTQFQPVGGLLQDPTWYQPEIKPLVTSRRKSKKPAQFLLLTPMAMASKEINTRTLTPYAHPVVDKGENSSSATSSPASLLSCTIPLQAADSHRSLYEETPSPDSHEAPNSEVQPQMFADAEEEEEEGTRFSLSPRQTNNIKERRRRARIKNACDRMRQLVPGLCQKTDKATVFEFSARYIQFLKTFVAKSKDKEFLIKNSPYG